MKYLLSIGIILMFAAVAFIIIGSLSASEKPQTKVAVGGIIGFIPFGFATDKKMLWFAMILSAVIFVFFILLRFMWR